MARAGHRRLAGRPRPSGGPATTADSEQQIRELLEARARAFDRRDATSAAAGYDHDFVLYDAIGLQVAVHHRGRQVVDAVAGVADSANGRPVTPQTPFFSFSTGKVWPH